MNSGSEILKCVNAEEIAIRLDLGYLRNNWWKLQESRFGVSLWKLWVNKVYLDMKVFKKLTTIGGGGTGH